MEQIVVDHIPVKKIYKSKAIWAGTFIGGPMVAGYLIAENFKSFNEPGKVKSTWIYSVLATVALFWIIFQIPEDVNVPRQFFPLLYTGVAYFIVFKFQSFKITEHLQNGGSYYSIWRSIGLGLIGGILTILPILGFLYFTDPTVNSSTRTYGKLNHEIIYKEGNIAVKEIDAIADGLTKTGFFDDAHQSSIFVEKTSLGYEIFMPVMDEAWKDPEFLSYCHDLKYELQSYFLNKNIITKLCPDGDISTVKKTL